MKDFRLDGEGFKITPETAAAGSLFGLHGSLDPPTKNPKLASPKTEENQKRRELPEELAQVTLEPDLSTYVVY